MPKELKKDKALSIDMQHIPLQAKQAIKTRK